MANVEFDGEFYDINLSASVGLGRTNLRDDVALVQAMLKYGLTKRPYFQGIKFTEPNGLFDSNTAALIKRYQQYLRRKLGVSVSVDGRIDPAKKTSAFGRNGKWTISLLNIECLEIWLLSGTENDNYIHDLYQRFPILRSAINPPVGTLSLQIEPSMAGVGTLGLALE